MAKLNTEIKVTCTEYRILFLPFAKYAKTGEAAVFTILGCKLYQRYGNKRKLAFWILPNAN